MRDMLLEINLIINVLIDVILKLYKLLFLPIIWRFETNFLFYRNIEILKFLITRNAFK